MVSTFEGNRAETKTMLPVIEKSFRMSKSDLRARPVYHRKLDSIEAHLTVVADQGGGFRTRPAGG
jgi:hypothetical protein